MKKQKRSAGRWRLCLMAAFLLAVFTMSSVPVLAAPRTGTYEKHFVGMGADSYRTVVIKKIRKKKVVFQIQYARSYPFRESATAKITGVRKGNKVTFSYREPGWNSAGTGTMKLGKNYVKIKTTATGGYGFIDTGGQAFKLKRVSGKKKFV